jgi:hypothetical protein
MFSASYHSTLAEFDRAVAAALRGDAIQTRLIRTARLDVLAMLRIEPLASVQAHALLAEAMRYISLLSRRSPPRAAA